MECITNFKNFIRKSGYVVSDTSYPEIYECIREDSEGVSVIQLIDITAFPVCVQKEQKEKEIMVNSGSEYKADIYNDSKREKIITRDIYIKQTENVMSTIGRDDIQIITLFFGNDERYYSNIAGTDPDCWMINTRDYILVVNKEEITDRFEVKNLVIGFLMKMRGDYSKGGDESIAKVSLILVIINVIIYIGCVIFGNTVTDLGKMDYEPVNEGQIYRLFTAMFLHGGIDHLINNMISLYFMGSMVERVLGRYRYLLIYIFSGIAGNLFSFGYEKFFGLRYSSVGASGAVYGILGAIVVLSLKKVKGLDVSIKRIFLAVFFCIYSSFSVAGIDYAAHIGGLIGGIVITFAVYSV